MRGYTPDIQIYFCVCVSATLGELVSVCNIEIVESGQFNLLTISQAVEDFVDFLANNLKFQIPRYWFSAPVCNSVFPESKERGLEWFLFSHRLGKQRLLHHCFTQQTTGQNEKGIISTLEKGGYKWSTDRYVLLTSSRAYIVATQIRNFYLVEI